MDITRSLVSLVPNAFLTSHQALLVSREKLKEAVRKACGALWCLGT